MDHLIDPVTLEVVRNRLDAIAEEMQVTLIRSAYSNIVKEGHDASAALFDGEGQMVAQATALPAQLGALAPAVRRVLEAYPVGEMRPGDLFILNDPYDGGTHLPDIVLAAPIFHVGSVCALGACIAHHQDVGGKTPGSIPTDATEIFQEGLRIPPLRLYDGGVPDTALHALIERNVRVPEVVLGDLRAQIASLHVARLRLDELLESHGAAETQACFLALLAHGDQLTRQWIQRIPDGEYAFSDYLDDDGIDLGRLIEICVTVRVRGSELEIDFSGTSPQVRGPVNADRSAVLSAVYCVVRAVTDPDIPNNAGCYRSVHVHLPEGSLVNPLPPAPVNGRTVTMKRIASALLGAFVGALPERIPAAHSGISRVMMFGGYDPVSGERFVCTDMGTGGTGAHAVGDGVDSLETDIGNTMNIPAEALELSYPLRVVRSQLWPDSAGGGRWRGGLGVDREIELLRGEATVTMRDDRHRTQPWGLFGGLPAASGYAEVVRSDGTHEPIPAKGIHLLTGGDRIRCWSAGGAGFGDPLERETKRVLDDVLDGKVTEKAAREEYGVVLSPGPTVNEAATDARRAELRRLRGAITWTVDRGRGERL